MSPKDQMNTSGACGRVCLCAYGHAWGWEWVGAHPFGVSAQPGEVMTPVLCMWSSSQCCHSFSLPPRMFLLDLRGSGTFSSPLLWS